MNDILTTLTDIIDFLKKTNIQTGRIPSTNVASGAYVDVSVTFPKAYSDIPTVQLTFVSDSTSGTFGRCTCSVHSRTTTGCKVRIYNGDTSQRSPAITWMAYGK